MTDPSELPPAIPAATVVVIRDGSAGVETLMLRRNSRIAFGGMWAFPGGKVDPVDAVDDDEQTARRCATREAAEEADLVLAVDALEAFAHWEPPPVIPKRFATWFFLAELPGGPDGDVLVDGGEIDEHRWLPAGNVLAERDAGTIELAPPTWVTLHDLSRFSTSREAMAWAAGVEVPRYVTHWREVDGGAVAMWHGDAGYEASDPLLEGPRHRLWMTEGNWRLERS